MERKAPGDRNEGSARSRAGHPATAETREHGGEDDDLSGDAAGGQERRDKLAAETDDLVDEIDDVLEENAEDFVRAYVQKGGQ